MAIGTTTALLLGIGSAAAGIAAPSIMNNSNQKTMAQPMPLPQPPSVDNTTDKAQEIIRRKRATASQTIFSSPLGDVEKAQINKKILLGQ